MRDFTLIMFELLLRSFVKQEYSFHTFELFLAQKPERSIIIRHDIDDSKFRALKFAEMERRLGISSSYYFRIKKCSFNEDLMRRIADMGHEIGYHYEDLSLNNGNFEKAIVSFEKNLNTFRKIYPVKTICMHGRALSKYDNRALWTKYNYRDFGIIGEPYFDLNYDKVLYLTDTGQSWSGSRYSIRDKVKSKYDFNFHSTFDIIANIDKLPDQIMITSHPDRWAFSLFEWYVINTHMKTRDRLKRILFRNRSINIMENDNQS